MRTNPGTTNETPFHSLMPDQRPAEPKRNDSAETERAKIDLLRDQLREIVDLKSKRPRRPGFRFCCAEELILEVGREYVPTPLPKGARRLPHKSKYCFTNAMKAATRRRGWIYTEGFGLTEHGGAVHHAWLTTIEAPGAAYDPTWQAITGAPADAAYLGVALRNSYFSQILSAKDTALNRYKYGYPELREGVDLTQMFDIEHSGPGLMREVSRRGLDNCETISPSPGKGRPTHR